MASRQDTRWAALTSRLVVAALLIILAVLIVVPLALLAVTSLTIKMPFTGHPLAWTWSNYGVVASADFGHLMYNTLIVATAGTALAMVLGCSLAWLAARTDVPCKGLIYLAGIAPLFLSLIVASILWSLLGSGKTGYLNLALASVGAPFEVNLRSLAGIAFVMGIYYAPYPFLLSFNALTLINPELEEAALLHQASVFGTLRHVTLPLVAPAILGSAVMILVLMIEDFPVPQILGGPVGIETLSMRIYQLIAQFPSEPNRASALGVLLTLLAVGLTFFQRALLRSRQYRTVGGRGVRGQPVRLGAVRWIAGIFVLLYVLLSLGLPSFALVQSALRDNVYIPTVASLFDVSHFTFRHVVDALTDVDIKQSARNSVIVSSFTALLGTLLFFTVAYVVGRTALRGRAMLEYVAMVPLAVPSLILGLGVLWTWLVLPLPLYGTLGILVVAFIARFLPQGYRSIASTISQVGDDLEAAALVSGASRVAAVRYIVLPLVRGGVASSAFLLFILAFRELTGALFLYTTNTRVLSIAIFELFENGAWSSVASVSLIYTVGLVGLTLIGQRWLKVEL